MLKGLVLSLALLCGCGANFNLRGPTATALNVALAASEAGAESMLAAKCVAEAAALHLAAHREAGRCVRDSAPHVATDAERAELARVRAQWRVAVDAYEAYAFAHDAARAAAQTGNAETLAEALVSLHEAYTALRAACAILNVRLPELR